MHQLIYGEPELPHIATLSLPASSPTPMSAPSLPPIRPASEQQAAQRKRAATVPGKTGRQGSNSGPKVVACNFCRGEFCRDIVVPGFTSDDDTIQRERPSAMALIRRVRAVLDDRYRAIMCTTRGRTGR
jgi:hypothetical protein